MKFFKIAMIAMCTAPLTSATEASINITYSDVEAIASDNVNGLDSSDFIGTVIPTPSNTTINANSGTTFSKNMIDWSIVGGQTVLSFGMDHARAGADYASAETIGAFVRFTANANEPYELTGTYRVVDGAPNQTSEVYQYAYLEDVSGPTLFEGYQYSLATPDQQFALGGTAGDADNYRVGSLTGNLISGHDYRLGFDYLLFPRSEVDAGASADGNLTLTIGVRTDGPAIVPEPVSLVIWSLLGLLGACIGCRRLTTST